MDSLLKITEFNDLNQIDFALSKTISYYKGIIETSKENKFLVEDAERQLVIFRSLKDKTRDAINEYFKK